MNKFVLPENWHVVVTEENKEVLSEWRNINTILEVGKIVGMDGNGKGHNPVRNIKGDFYDFGVEITFEQFRKYVLGIEEEIIPEYVKDVNDKVLLLDYNHEVTVTKTGHGDYYYLDVLGQRNDFVFNELEIDQSIFYAELFDYTPRFLRDTGCFPEVKSIGDLNKVIHSLKKIIMEKTKIIGYKLIKPEYRQAASIIADLNNFGYFEKYLDSNDKDIIPNYEICKNKLIEAGVFDLWFEPIHQSITQTINMGSFELTIKGKAVYHRSEDITQFVKDINERFGSLLDQTEATKNTSYTFKVDDIIFNKTGCEHNITKLSDWLKIYDKIK